MCRKTGYRIEWTFRNGDRQNVGDPYRFTPTLGDLDRYLIGEGTHLRLWEALGARAMTHEGVEGVAFSVWAPNALAVAWWEPERSGWPGPSHAKPRRRLGAVRPARRGGALQVRGGGRRWAVGTEIRSAGPTLRDPTLHGIRRRRACHRVAGRRMDRRSRCAAAGRSDVDLQVHLGSWRLNPLEEQPLADLPGVGR